MYQEESKSSGQDGINLPSPCLPSQTETVSRGQQSVFPLNLNQQCDVQKPTQGSESHPICAVVNDEAFDETVPELPVTGPAYVTQSGIYEPAPNLTEAISSLLLPAVQAISRCGESPWPSPKHPTEGDGPAWSPASTSGIGLSSQQEQQYSVQQPAQPASSSKSSMYPALPALVPTAPPPFSPPTRLPRFCWPGQAWLGPSSFHPTSTASSFPSSRPAQAAASRRQGAGEGRDRPVQPCLSGVGDSSSGAFWHSDTCPPRQALSWTHDQTLQLRPLHSHSRSDPDSAPVEEKATPNSWVADAAYDQKAPPSSTQVAEPVAAGIPYAAGNLAGVICPPAGGDSPVLKPTNPLFGPQLASPPAEPQPPISASGSRPKMARPPAFFRTNRWRARPLLNKGQKPPPPAQPQNGQLQCLLCNGRLCCLFMAALLQFIVGVTCLVFGVVFLWGKDRVNIMLETKQDSQTRNDSRGVDFTGNLEPFNVAGLLKSGFVALMLAGVSILVLGFLGCCGVMMRSKLMVASYGVIVLLIALGQTAAAGLALCNKQEAQQILRQSLLDNLRSSYSGRANASSVFSHAMDLVQMTFGCCGVTGSQDFYNATPWWFEQPYNCSPCAAVPSTCCKLLNASITDSYLLRVFHADKGADKNRLMLADPMCPYKTVGPDNPNTHVGCFQAIMNEINKHIVLVLVLAVLVVLVESYAVSSAFRVVNLLRRQDQWLELQERQRHVGSCKRRLAALTLNLGPGTTMAPPSTSAWI